MTTFAHSRTIRSCTVLVAFCSALVLSACGATTGGGGGGSVGTVGGKIDSACNEAYGEGCYAFNGTTQREKCVGGKWTLVEVCAQGTACQEKILVAGQPARTTECKAVAVTPGPDTMSTADGTGGGSDGTGDGSDTTAGGTDAIGGTDTTGGKDTVGGDTTGSLGELLACAQTKCPDQWASCAIDTQCQAVVACFSTCTADAITCASQCQASGNNLSLSLLQCAQTACIGGGAVCGNGKCESGETSTCPSDCATGPVCGNGTCESGENSTNCSLDCPPANLCGNGKCDTGETPLTCIQDCTTAKCCAGLGYKCGDVPECAGSCGICSGTQTCNAAHKCVAGGPVCGNGTCESGETSTSCPSDCPPATTKVCGDLVCVSGETSTTCPLDCPPTGCNNGICSGTETKTSCPQDCDPSAQCMLNNCQTEWVGCVTNTSCASILSCIAKCATGNTTCAQTCYNSGTSGGQTLLTSYSTCYANNNCSGTTNNCGNGVCDSGETNATCPSDCPAATDPGCTSKSTPGCGGCSCESSVCASDSYCCSTAWDSTCVNECKTAGTTCP